MGKLGDMAEITEIGQILKLNRRPQESPELDPSTLSNYDKFEVKGTSLDLEVSFDEKRVGGIVRYQLEVIDGFESIKLDTSWLEIELVEVNGIKTNFSIGERQGPLGSCLQIEYGCNVGDEVDLSIWFKSTLKCTALQFLDPEATDGKKAPYLFSQCQAIHARSFFPCFDTPSVKSPYEMKVKTPYPALMSGRPVKQEKDTYYFDQPIPIPSYLVALASGDMAKAKVGRRSHVYSEPTKIDACQYEFENDMERFLTSAESLVFDYEWDQYDVLVLPSSFPYGGMENPNVTFATPTLISGDRENVDVIAHELAHSWSGNLVTNCSWEHFWLNEGWTVYLERRIVGKIHGEASRHFGAIIGWNDLQNSILAMGDSAKRYSTLVQNLKDRSDPDDAFSTVPYEKGSTLLFHIEQVVGGKSEFDPFIPHYFNKFKFKSLDTFQFLDTLYQFFADKKDVLDSIQWHKWLFEPGMPPVKPQFDTSLVDQCYHLADKWIQAIKAGDTNLTEKFSSHDIQGFSANQSVVFLDTLVSFDRANDFSWSQHPEVLQLMAQIYAHYSSSKNAEVLFRWYVLQVTGRNTVFYDFLGQWLGTVGRMKFVRPGYVLLNKANHELAIAYFKKFKSTYHPICKVLVKKDLGLA